MLIRYAYTQNPRLRKQPNPSRVYFLSILGGHLPTNTGEMSFCVLTGLASCPLSFLVDQLQLTFFVITGKNEPGYIFLCNMIEMIEIHT